VYHNVNMADYDIHSELDRIIRCLTQADAVSAEKFATQLTLRFPENAEAWFLLGVARHLLQKLSDALIALDQAVSLSPAHVQAMRAKAAVLSELGQLDAAIETCRQTLQMFPQDADLVTNLATVLEKNGQLTESLEQFDLALALDPHHLFALQNRGALLMRMYRLEAALAHNRLFVERHPEYPDAYYNLSETLCGLRRYQEALPVCEAGLSIAPRHARLHLNRGISLAATRRFEESQYELAQAQILDPELLKQLVPEINLLPSIVDPYTSPEVVYLETNTEAMHECIWHNRSSYLDTIHEFSEQGTPSSFALHDKKLAFTLLALPTTSARHLAILKNVSEYVEDTAWLYARPPFRHDPDRHQNGTRIRIGYVSPDFRDHPIGHLTKAIYALHDRNRFEIHCYSLVRAEQDPVQQQIRNDCDLWHDLSDMDNVAAAEQIYADGINILIDLAGYTKQARTEIFALRPAPIQVNYLGYPGTMGATFMDYLIGDLVVTPSEHAAHFTEKLLQMPHTYQPNSRPQELSLPLSRLDCGLPETGFIFCGFNQAFKISPEIFDIWMGLLREVPGSVLWLLEAGPIAEQNLRKEAQLRGVDSQKLIFAPRVPWLEHLNRQQHVDLLLDTFPYNAHTTASDALWAGVPLVTCIGETFPSRVAASLLTAAGLPELVTNSLEEYEKLALHFATSPDELNAIRKKLIANRSTAPLFDTKRFVRDLETLYERMMSRIDQ